MSRSNLATRLITAAIASPLLLALLFWGPVLGWYLLVLAATAAGAWEFFHMTHPNDRLGRVVGTVLACGWSFVLYQHASDPRALLTAVAVIPAAGFLLHLWRLGEIPSAGFRMMGATAGPMYLGLLTFLALIRKDLGGQGPGYVLMTLMFAWMADTGGYFVGRFFGKRKLYPAVSPGKTREGFYGALAGAVVGGLLAHFWYLPSIPLLDAIGLAVLCGALGQMGDLLESLLKRSTAIKDSGTILPGHGGLLDRVDGLLLVAPTVYLYALWSNQLAR